MNMKQLMEWELTEETQILRGNLPQCHFVHHKSHISWPGIEPGPQRWKTDNEWYCIKCWSRVKFGKIIASDESRGIWKEVVLPIFEQSLEETVNYINVRMICPSLINFIASPCCRFIKWKGILQAEIKTIFSGSTVDIATGYGLDGRGVESRVPVRRRFFSSPRRPDWFCGIPSLPSNGCQWLFPRR
jgi:hypothetical protein